MILLAGCGVSPHGGPVFIPFTWLPDSTQDQIGEAVFKSRLSQDINPTVAQKTEKWLYHTLAPAGVSFEEFRGRMSHFTETVGKKRCHGVVLRSADNDPKKLRTFYFDMTGSPQF